MKAKFNNGKKGKETNFTPPKEKKATPLIKKDLSELPEQEEDDLFLNDDVLGMGFLDEEFFEDDDDWY